MRTTINWLGAAVVMATLYPGAADPAIADTTFSCSAVKDEASVGVPDGVSVNIATTDLVCDFSVSGASVSTGSTAPVDLKTSVSDLLRTARANDPAAARPIGDLLLSPLDRRKFKADQLAEFEAIVQKPGNALIDCVQAFDKPTGTTDFSNQQFFCSVLQPGTPLRLGDHATMTSSHTGIVLGIKLPDGATSATYLPDTVLR